MSDPADIKNEILFFSENKKCQEIGDTWCLTETAVLFRIVSSIQPCYWWNDYFIFSWVRGPRRSKSGKKTCFSTFSPPQTVDFFELDSSKNPPWNSTSPCFCFRTQKFPELSRSGLESAKNGHCRRRESIGEFGPRPRPSHLPLSFSKHLVWLLSYLTLTPGW